MVDKSQNFKQAYSLEKEKIVEKVPVTRRDGTQTGQWELEITTKAPRLKEIAEDRHQKFLAIKNK